MKTKVTIIGLGIMGKSIAKAISKNDSRIGILGIDKKSVNVDKMYGHGTIRESNFVILAIKPQNAPEVLERIKTELSEKSILISIMAGVPIKKISTLAKHKKVVRMMPNLGLSVGAGIATWKAVGLSKSEKSKTKKFLTLITDNIEVTDEDKINKTTAISGSGPAYFFLLAHSMYKAGVKLGLSGKESRKLVEQTFLSAALLQEGSEYSTLIGEIASKGGTTEAALKILKNKNFENIVYKAVESAYKRAKQLSK